MAKPPPEPDRLINFICDRRNDLKTYKHHFDGNTFPYIYLKIFDEDTNADVYRKLFDKLIDMFSKFTEMSTYKITMYKNYYGADYNYVTNKYERDYDIINNDNDNFLETISEETYAIQYFITRKSG